MSIGSTLKKALGFVAGILIPGASREATDIAHTIQQHFADLYGEVAAKLAETLKLDTTGLSGPEKVFCIAEALVDTAVSQGFKGDVALLKTVLLDLAQTAYRKDLPTIEANLVALVASLHLAPALEAVTELVVPSLVKAG